MTEEKSPTLRSRVTTQELINNFARKIKLAHNKYLHVIKAKTFFEDNVKFCKDMDDKLGTNNKDKRELKVLSDENYQQTLVTKYICPMDKCSIKTCKMKIFKKAQADRRKP